MALRLDANGDYLYRTANLPSSTAFTICGWFRRRGTGGTNQFLVGIDDGAGGNAIACVIGLAGSYEFRVYSSGSGSFVSTGVAVTQDQWYFVALSCGGTGASDAQVRHAAPGATSLTTASTTGDAFTATGYGISTAAADYWANVALAGWKLYDRVLTDAELLAEMNRLTPASTTNLNLWTPMVHDVAATAAKDFSGNGRDWTVAGTLTVEDGPPVGWGAPVLVVGAAASGSTYDDTLTESVTAGQSFTNTAVFVSGVSESATAGDAYAAALTAPAALSESATLGDAFVGAAVQSATLTEDVEFGESMAVSAAFVASLSDAAILADAYAPAHTMPATISEPVTLADVYSPALTISVTLVESATLGDGATPGTIYNDTLDEAVSPADVYSAVLTISATVSESVAASDAYASVAVMAAAIIEAFTPADAFGAGAIFPTTIGESTTLGDSYPDEHNQSGSDSFTESVSLVDDYTAQAAFAAGLVESASMGDAFTVELVIPVAIAESVSLADAYEAARLVTADLEESVVMADAVASVLQAITTLAEDVTLDDSMLGTVAGTLAVDLPHTRRVGPRVMSFGTARVGSRRMQFGVRRIGPRTIKGD